MEKTEKIEKNVWKLQDGYEIPQIGFGNYNSFGEEEINAVRWALEAGYRYIDSASCYKNEVEVGEAIRQFGGPREEIFLLSKLWPTDYEHAEAALMKTMKELGVDYLDVYLIHWPGTDETKRLHAYEQLLPLREKGYFRTLGVSNFQPDQMERLKEVFGEYPVINQMECHPSFQQREISDYCKAHEIQVIDYRPINRGAYAQDVKLQEIAAKYGKSVQQVVLRWHIEHGQVPIPKSANQGRIRENINIFDFSLTEEEIHFIDSMETGQRAGSDPFSYNG